MRTTGGVPLVWAAALAACASASGVPEAASEGKATLQPRTPAAEAGAPVAAEAPGTPAPAPTPAAGAGAATQPAATAGEPQAVSLLGQPLYPPLLGPEVRERLEQNLAAARAAYEAGPDDADRIIWLGRRLAYLGRYREAIATFSEGIRKHPDDPRMFRHRGHRYITLRELDNAMADLEQAASLIRGKLDEVEPDGAPNPYNIPTSTLQSNIWYHLGLAHYLRGDFERALPAYLECLKVSNNPDMLVATSDWLYMTLRRLGRAEEAALVLEPIHQQMKILENHAYHRRLLMYRGEIPPDALLDAGSGDPVELATQGYGVGNWYLYNGERERALEVFRRVLTLSNWAAFGYIAAEAELARGRGDG
ncbi:MAG: tetratricopeptide repeat protein [Gemmatimonadetes bacterium]|nr:tetratricopeptide repeat protein [Gemmatimonadota bacterium]